MLPDPDPVRATRTIAGRRLGRGERLQDQFTRGTATPAIRERIDKWEEDVARDLALLGDVFPFTASTAFGPHQTPSSAFRPPGMGCLDEFLAAHPHADVMEPLEHYLAVKVRWLTSMWAGA